MKWDYKAGALIYSLLLLVVRVSEIYVVCAVSRS